MFAYTLLILALAFLAWAQDTTEWAATAVTTTTVLRTVTILGNAAESSAPAPATTPPPPPSSAATPTPPAPTTLETSFTNRCDDIFCSLGSKVCFYWGGIASYDITRGPIPGETHTMLGPCTNVTSTVAETVLKVTHMNPAGTLVTDITTVPAYATVVEQW